MADGCRQDRSDSKINMDNNGQKRVDGNCDTKHISDNIADKNKVKLSFYVERDLSEVNEKSESSGVAKRTSAVVSSGRPQFSTGCSNSEKDGRKKRCVDRYDSSESSDSGVTVSCSTDSSGCSSGDITEPGSPYSPASSAHSDDSHLAGPRMPTAAANHAPWPWATAAVTPPSATPSPTISPSPRRATKRPRREAATVPVATAEQDFEKLLDSCIKRSTNNNEPARATRCCAPDIDKQGRITEYFKSQMKPFNNAKRDLVWNNKTNAIKKKPPKEKEEIEDDLAKYISYLSQNLNTKVPMKAQRVKKEINEQEKTCIMTKVQNAKSCTVASSLAQSNPSLLKLLEQEKPPTNMNSKKTPIKEHLSSTALKKKIPMQTKRNIAPKTKTQSSKPMLLNKCRQKADQPATISIKPAMSAEPHMLFPHNRDLKQANYPSIITSSPDTSPRKINTLANGLRQIMPLNGTAIFNQMAINDRQNCNNLSTIPLQNAMTQHCSGGITNANTQYPLMALPQGMMVMRIPPTGNAPQQVNIPNNMSHSYNHNHNTNVNISSPTKLNNQFMFPFVQNFNGTMVQIPNIMTKVAQNIVIPNPPQQRHETVTAQQSSSHMVINGSLVKITSGVHTNFSGILTKPQQPNTNNFNFQTTHKNLNTGVPTMVVSKSNYPMNVGHQLLAPSSGFLINPMSNLITTQAQLNLEYNQTNMQNGMIITGAQNNMNHNNSSHISSSTLCNQLMNTSSIPIAPVKPPDEQARLPHNVPVSLTGSVPSVIIGNVITSTTTVRDSITIYNTAQPTCTLPISSICSSNSTANSIHQNFPEIQNTSTVVIESTTEKSVNSCQISNGSCFTQKEVHRTSDSVINGRKLEEVVSSLLEKRIERSLDSGKNGKTPVLSSLLEKLPLICSKENSQNVDIIECLSEKCDIVLSPKFLSEPKCKPVIEYNSEKGCDLRKPVAEHDQPLECSRMETEFTEITLLKDNVLSSVHNSILESSNSSPSNNVSNSLEDECEVTDKSIDSPTESTTSKDFDDDSVLNLNLTDISSEQIESGQKSPILSEPKVIRFPVSQSRLSSSSRNGRESSSTPTILACQWENCMQSFDGDTDILEHLQMVHVNAQNGRENYVCLWLGCKVRGRPSCSRLWLERHALSHGGNKPFRCIVDNCGRRFTTQVLLEKHVNSHFDDQSPSLANGKKSAESSGPKLIRRNGKKLRYRRQPWSARMFDYFDGGIMEGVRWRVAASTAWRTGGAWWPSADPRPHGVTARVARVLATRHAPPAAAAKAATLSGRQALVRWHPPNLLEDEWIPEDEVKSVRRVPIASLSAAAKVVLYDEFCASYRSHTHTRTHATPPTNAKRYTRIKTETHTKSHKIAHDTRHKKPPLKTLADFFVAARKNSVQCNVNKVEIKSEFGNVTAYADVKVEQETLLPRPVGAAKRKQGRPQGGGAFWPSGR